jgi:hypothetical protein
MTSVSAVPSRIADSFAPPPLPMPTWTPVDIGVRLGLSAPYAELALTSLKILVVVLVALLWSARIGRGGSVDSIAALGRRDLVAILAPLAALLLIPYGPGWGHIVDFDGSLLVAVGILAFGSRTAASGMLRRGVREDDRVGMSRASAEIDLALLVSLLGPVMLVGGSSATEIVDGQRALGLPFGVVLPVGTACFAFATVHATTISAPGRAETGWGAATEAYMLALACIGVTAFLGGWWIPGFEWAARAGTERLGGRGLVSWQYACVTLSLGVTIIVLKVSGLLWLLKRLARARFLVARSGTFDMDHGLVRIALVGAVVSAIGFVVGLPARQGGIFGFVEATRVGTVVGSRVFGYGYLLVTAILTVGVVSLVALTGAKRSAKSASS